jgi:outer membrane protein OmpA-like peptidoglycan-associated protein
MTTLRLVTLLVLLAGADQAGRVTPVATGTCAPAGGAAFGTATKTPVSIEGRIYFLSEDARSLPDFASLKSEGSVFTDRWEIGVREFTIGFPGVTDRFEWFALDYEGSIYVPLAGDYGFRLESDDGSKLYLDGTLVVDNDGVHAMSETAGAVTLRQGDHRFRLSYFQGPATEIGLKLFVTPPGGPEKIFRLQDFNKDVLDNRGLLGVTENETEIRVRFGAEVLFDTARFDLKPLAQDWLEQLALLLRAYPAHPIVIEGHTDNVGTAKANELLSRNRARSVRDWLVTQGQIAAACISTQGFGATQPVADNGTADGRQKNRRVEVKIEKGAS